MLPQLEQSFFGNYNTKRNKAPIPAKIKIHGTKNLKTKPINEKAIPNANFNIQKTNAITPITIDKAKII